MKRAILLRHGVTEANRLHRYCGSTDLPLDAGALMEFRANRPVYPSADGFRILASGMLRTEQTLRELYGEVPHETLPAFREIDFGAFENHSYEELKDDQTYRPGSPGTTRKTSAPAAKAEFR